MMLGGVLEHGKVRKHRSVGRIVAAVSARERPAEHRMEPALDNLTLARDMLESLENTNDIVGRDVGDRTGADNGENVLLEDAHPARGCMLGPRPSAGANGNDGLGRLGKGDGRGAGRESRKRRTGEGPAAPRRPRTSRTLRRAASRASCRPSAL